MITQKTTTVLKRMKYNQIIFSVQNVAYVTIIHRHAILEYDGLNSTDDFPEIITEHFFVISPDLQHDHNFTTCAQQQIKQYLDSISYDVDVMHEFRGFQTILSFYIRRGVRSVILLGLYDLITLIKYYSISTILI
jgi:hypothetical protein